MSPLVYLTLMLALGVIAQWCAWRFKLPSILLLLAFGFALGQFTGVRIDDYLAPVSGHGSPLLSVVGLFVAIILFEGGLTLKFSELKESGLPILRLCTIAVALSFLLTTGFMLLGLGFDIRLAALAGAILTVTGPTVIAPLLRHVNPTRKVAAIVKWEGIVVDPIGALLGVLVFIIARSTGDDPVASQVLLAIGKVLLAGIVGGVVVSKAVELSLRRYLIPDFLQPVFLLAVVAVSFTVSNMVEKEAGLLTVTVLGILLANQKTVPVRHILEFKENLRTLIISSLFIVLPGRISLDEMTAILPSGLALLAFLILVGRPLSVFGALVGSKQTKAQERIFLAFLAPRGIVAAAVTSIFAMEFEMAANHGLFGDLGPVIALQSQQLTALIFLVIVGTVAIYGLGASPLARALGLASRNPTGILFAGADSWTRLAAKALHDDGHRVMLLDTNYPNVASAKMLGLEAQRANILSEFAEHELEFNGIGSLVAGTSNDEVNSLAALRFIHQFGRANVWQLKPSERAAHHRNTTSADIRVQNCFTGCPGHEQLEQLALAGAVVKKSTLTDKFTFDDFRTLYNGAAAIVLFISDPQKGLRPAPGEINKLPPGTTLYTLVPQFDSIN